MLPPKPTTASPPARLRARVVIAIEPPGEYTEALELAARMAARLEAQLEALMVEDTGLLDAAHLPFTQAFDRSGRASHFDDNAVRRAWHTERLRLGRAIRRCTLASKVQVNLRTIQGRFLSAALAQAEQFDVVLLAHSRSLTQSLSSTERNWLRTKMTTRSTSPALTRRARPVWVFFDGTDASLRALELGQQLASDYGCELVVFHPEDDQVRAKLNQLTGAHTELAARLTCIAVTSSASEVLGTMKRAEGCSLVLTPRSSLDEQNISPVLDALARQDCRLVLVA